MNELDASKWSLDNQYDEPHAQHSMSPVIEETLGNVNDFQSGGCTNSQLQFSDDSTLLGLQGLQLDTVTAMSTEFAVRFGRIP
jgi:hypothetical protein